MRNIKNQEYSFLGNTIENISIKYGMFLVLWASAVTFISNSQSITYWTPAFYGSLLFFLGWLTRLLKQKRAFLLIFKAFIGLLVTLNGLGFLRSFFISEKTFENFLPNATEMVLTITGFIFLYLSLKSLLILRQVKRDDG